MKHLKLIILTLIFSTLTACGGGDQGYGNASKTSTTDDESLGSSEIITGNIVISLSLISETTGQSTTSISSSSPGILQATVTNSGSPVTSAVVTFSTTLGNLTPSTTALTNASGIATINLEYGGQVGAGTATAAVTASGESASTSTNFQITNTVVTTTIDMGHGTGTDFVPDVISIWPDTTLSAGGTLTASINIVETSKANAPYTPPVDIVFESPCIEAMTATIDSPVTTSNGAASSTYRADGCVGTDTITARATIGGTTYTATANVTIEAPTVGSIKFISASQKIIAIQGTGGSGLSETSTVTFSVLDASDNPVPNQTVNFYLDTTVGGITMNPITATSNANGQVQTVVKSGTVSTSVIVTATVASTSISTSSVALAVSTGRPVNDSFSISASVLNPSVWECDGGIVPITVRATDHFKNPAPDGTSISFRTEGGSIEPNCTTLNGKCTVNWESISNPDHSDGRITILATAIGEESYTDGSPSNGRFDDAESYVSLPEAWLDINENGVRDAPDEEYIDFNNNEVYDLADNRYNGVLCSDGSTICNPGVLVHVRDSLTLVMASIHPTFKLYETTTGTDTEVLAAGISLAADKSVKYFRVDIEDARGQLPPAGSTISVSTSNGEIIGGSSTVVLNSSAEGPASLHFAIQADGNEPYEGVLTISVDVPGSHCQGGLKTSVYVSVSEAIPATP